MAAGGLPQVAVREWTDSLVITDVDGAAASLNYACVIDSKVNGSVPAHDNAYNSWRMEFVVSFDRAIKKNGDVTLYGQIHNDGLQWAGVQVVTGEKKNNVWFPVTLSATAAGREIELIDTMLDAKGAYYVAYNTTQLFPASGNPYILSFAGLIETFYCGISFRSREYLGTTCTIDVVLINPDNATDRRTLTTIKYRYDEDRYRDTDPGQWFNARIGWYEQLPRDLDKCQNCTVSNADDYVELAAPGRLDCDGGTVFAAQGHPASVGHYPATVKRMVAKVVAGSFGWQTFDQMRAQFEADPLGGYKKTAAFFAYAEDGVTNMAGLVQHGTTNTLVRLAPGGVVDYAGDLECAITVRSYPGGVAYVSYEVNGVPFAYGGRRDIQVRQYAVEDKLAVVNGVVADVYGDMERLPAGQAVQFR